MGLDEKTLKSLILRANPQQSVKRFKTGGGIGNEAVFRFCQLLKDAGVERQNACPYLRAWFDHWKLSLLDETGTLLELEEIIVMADELWDKIKFSAGGQLQKAIQRAAARIKNQTIPHLGNYGGVGTRMLALVCYELSQMDNPFFIAERDAAEILGLDREAGRRKARTTLKVFCNKRIIRMEKAGNQIRATRFLYTGCHPETVPENQKIPENPEDPRRYHMNQKTPED